MAMHDCGIKLELGSGVAAAQTVFAKRTHPTLTWQFVIGIEWKANQCETIVNHCETDWSQSKNVKS